MTVEISVRIQDGDVQLQSCMGVTAGEDMIQASSKRQNYIQTHTQLWDLWIFVLQGYQLEGLALSTCKAVGTSCRRLGWCLELTQPKRHRLTALAGPSLWHGQEG